MRTTVLFAVLVAFLTFASPARAEYAVDWSQYIDKDAARRPAPKQSASKGKRAKANKKIAAKSKAKKSKAKRSKAKARAKKKARRNRR